VALKKRRRGKKKEKHSGHLAALICGTFVMLFLFLLLLRWANSKLHEKKQQM